VLQFYANNTESTIEANYIFPLDSQAAVCDFQAEINGEIIQGRVKEKQQARQEYHAAVRRGDGACLLEQEQPDIFQVFVGNIPPLTRVNIRITYVVELDVEEEEFVKFILPTNIAPRYTPNAYVSTTSYRWIPYHKPWWSCWCDCQGGFRWGKQYYHRLVEVPHSSATDVIQKVNASVTRDKPYALSFYLQVRLLVLLFSD